MTIPVGIIALCLLIGAALIAVTVISVGAWYGVTKLREEEQQRLMRAGFYCPCCGSVIHFTGETLA